MRRIPFLFLIAFFSLVPISHAQEANNRIDDLSVVDQMYARIALKNPSVKPTQINSVFFTSTEEGLIISARQGFVTRPPTESEFEREQIEMESLQDIVRTGPREVNLGGILFVSSDEWTVWLNKQRITPKSIPSEVIDIQVKKDFIKLKWFDVQTNQIFPIKLRTHQRFNLDTRMFLPGT